VSPARISSGAEPQAGARRRVLRACLWSSRRSEAGDRSGVRCLLVGCLVCHELTTQRLPVGIAAASHLPPTTLRPTPQAARVS
jgi:hypothetical protein